MKIEGNQKELDAMVEFHKGNRVEGLRLQEEFAAEFRKEYKDKDHCPCLKACRYHGNCKECVAIHRAHQEHVPNCMRPLINKKLKLMSELTEHTLANEIYLVILLWIDEEWRHMPRFHHIGFGHQVFQTTSVLLGCPCNQLPFYKSPLSHLLRSHDSPNPENTSYHVRIHNQNPE